jgi:hypothetical protein
VTEKEAKFIKSYFCKKCRARNPKLEIIFKSKYKDQVNNVVSSKTFSVEEEC